MRANYSLVVYNHPPPINDLSYALYDGTSIITRGFQSKEVVLEYITYKCGFIRHSQ